MSDVAVGFLLNLMALTAIGFGPSLLLVSGKDRAGVALAIGPVVGLVLVCVFGSWLTMLDWPVSQWAMTVLIAGAFTSGALTLYLTVHDTNILGAADHRRCVLPVAAFACTAVLVMAPQMIGGLQYSILRGNGTDSFNYVLGAGALDHESFSWISSGDLQALADRHPSYIRAHALLETRWTTMMMLAFSSRIAGIDPYRFEYAFSALCLLLAFGLVFLWCRLIDVPRLPAALTATAVSAGFWGQFVLDERADAHQNAIPLVLLLGFLIVRITMLEGNRIRLGEHILLALTGTAILFVYPEISPMILLALAIFLGIRIVKLRTSGTYLAGLAFSAALAVLAALPLRNMLVHFVAMQLNYARTGVNTWHLAYFPWLYSSPLTGLWGFGPLVAGETSVARVFDVVLLPLGALLTVTLAAAFVRTPLLAIRYPAFALASTLAVASHVQWGYLYLRGQLWAGAKGLSFGYPFLIIAIVGYGLSPGPVNRTGWRSRLQATVAMCVMVFLVIQGALAIYRPWLTARGQDYTGYILGHGEYRQHNWDLAAFERVLEPQRDLTVWLNVSNPWVSDYIGLVLGWDVQLVNIGASVGEPERQFARRRTNQPPDYVIVDSGGPQASLDRRSRDVVATTGSLSLLKVDSRPTLMSVANPNGVEGTADAPFFWLGGDATILKVLTTSDGCALLSADFSPGPSRPDLAHRHVTLATSADVAGAPILIGEGPNELRFRMTTGLNELQLKVQEQATVALPADKRPLLLRVDDLRLESVPCTSMDVRTRTSPSLVRQ